jgi:hypothetical protein
MLSTRMLSASSGLGGYTSASVAYNVVKGNSTNAGTAGGTTITWNHTIAAGSNKLLTVFVGLVDAIGPITGVTFSGSALTKSGAISSGTGDFPRSEIWYLLAPPITTGSVVISFPGVNNYATGIAADWNGVNQS